MLLVTRPQPEADDEVRRLRAEGIEAIAAPCLAFSAIEAVPPSISALFAHPADLLVTSPRAAEFLPDPPANWRVLSLAPKTAEILLDRVIVPALTSRQGAAALTMLARPGPVIVATSDLGGQEVLRVRPDASIWPLYRTECPDSLPDAVRTALALTFDVWFTSPSTVANFEKLAPGALERAREVFWTGETTRIALAARTRRTVTHGPPRG